MALFENYMDDTEREGERVWWYATCKTKSLITFKRQFRQKYERDSPSKSCKLKWVKNFS